MQEKSKTLKLVLTNHWFDEIKSGRKKYEYRKATPFWLKRIMNACNCIVISSQIYFELPEENMPFVEFQKAYKKNAEKMTFKIKSISTIPGTHTDLQCDSFVYAIRLGRRIS